MDRPQTTSGRPGEAAPGGAGAQFDWKRFWVRSLIAVFIFNILAGLVTWYFIFPRLHPGGG